MIIHLSKGTITGLASKTGKSTQDRIKLAHVVKLLSVLYHTSPARHQYQHKSEWTDNDRDIKNFLEQEYTLHEVKFKLNTEREIKYMYMYVTKYPNDRRNLKILSLLKWLLQSFHYQTFLILIDVGQLQKD